MGADRRTFALECRIPQPVSGRAAGGVRILQGQNHLRAGFVCAETGRADCLAGVNGCGKSSLLRLLMGRPCPTAVQSCSLGECGYPMWARRRMCLWVRWRTMPVRREWRSTASRRFCARWDFQAQLERDASCFSTGERRKVLLAASLCQQAHLYLWDEPLNYIDVFSRMQIEELLLESCAVAFVCGA